MAAFACPGASRREKDPGGKRLRGLQFFLKIALVPLIENFKDILKGIVLGDLRLGHVLLA